jgi:hypothetical protein
MCHEQSFGIATFFSLHVLPFGCLYYGGQNNKKKHPFYTVAAKLDQTKRMRPTGTFSDHPFKSYSSLKLTCLKMKCKSHSDLVFLGASKRLYNTLCPMVHRLVCQLVCPSLYCFTPGDLAPHWSFALVMF